MVPALYLHIPFCSRICPFCSFAVRPDDPQKHDSYFRSVRHEFQLIQKQFEPDLSAVRSLYIGGGTPSCLSLDELGQWMNWLKAVATIRSTAQMSIEVNPEDVTPAYVQGLETLGFNRVSIGVQSFQDEGLKQLQRRHSPDQARQAISAIIDNGQSDINLDLMFGYPGQTRELLLADLVELVDWGPSHISVYCLNIEEKTPLFKKPEWQQWQDENEKLISLMYCLIVEQLSKHGYRQYEVSNFARKGKQSRQNLLNWRGRDYFGLGMGAHSLLDGIRWGNHRRWVDYRKSLADSRLPQQYIEKLTLEQLRDETLMLALRQNKGLNLAGFQTAFNLDLNESWSERLADLDRAGLITIAQDRLRLTTRGLLLADSITADLAMLLSD